MSIVYVGMSGGVDSSVSAFLLKEWGYDVRGITLVLSGVEGERKCCSIDEVKYAEYVCRYLGIPHEVISVKELFKTKIINPFIREYSLGRTPNACVNCNLYFKFGYILEYALSKGADFIATGHYAKVESIDGQYVLKEARDKIKDQSYFLARLTKFQLSKVIFPLSDLTKEEVKLIAKEAGLPLKPHQRESQDLCFVPGDDINRFLLDQGIVKNQGLILDDTGNIVGSHEGIQFYTIGQRRGLRVRVGKKVYVKYKYLDSNTLVVSENADFTGLIGSKLNWIWNKPVQGGLFSVKIRYRSSGELANVEILDGERIKVTFREKQFGVTPGQLAVLYSGDTVVGSAFIDESID
ncbi:MAG: tRNA 2-thiouridine(34) synthase MnmA [Spirochaetia bacterium]|nr:tRNA 2-thiouridine(34) synthase MnmA [Spirochaetota bacterium]MDW8112236.1 tRNA 2-thiouridine(34) synthase MnmA [Spirochaetia bacterium]